MTIMTAPPIETAQAVKAGMEFDLSIPYGDIDNFKLTCQYTDDKGEVCNRPFLGDRELGELAIGQVVTFLSEHYLAEH